MIDQILYNVRVVGQLFGVTNTTVRTMCRNGRIPCVNLGTFTRPRWRIPLNFIEEAMRGEARWKYPKRFKRQCISRAAAQRKIAHVNDELARIAGNEKKWSDDEDE